MLILLYTITTLIYFGLAIDFWYHSRKERKIEHIQKHSSRLKGKLLIVIVPLTLHGFLIYKAAFVGAEFRFGFSLALSLMLLLAVFLYWLQSFLYSLEGVQSLTLAGAALSIPLAALFPPTHVLIHTESVLFKAHFVVAMFAYALFTIAALHALLMLVIDKRLHKGNISGFLSNVPPLLTMEAILFLIIWSGFILLTLTLISGIMFSEAFIGKPFSFSHKIVFGITSWCIYGSLLAGRHFQGWRGQTALRWTLIGFMALLLAYIGQRFVLEIILNKTN